MKEAMLYYKLENNKVQCALCCHHCVISDGYTGICRVRKNEGGKLISLVYSKAISTHADPIEKKPFFHFFPGSYAYSIATAGCNFSCKFCQNYSISQIVRDHNMIPGEIIPPEDVVSAAIINKCKSISFTYTEPTIFFEYAYDIAVEAKKHGLYTNFVSNGYMTTEAIEIIAPYLDAINVDLKAMSEKFYHDLCGAKLEGVLTAIDHLVKKGIWVEVTTLLIPGFNDDEKQLKESANFLASVSTGIPWHVSRYHPDYEFSQAPPTPSKSLQRAIEIGHEAGLKYIYSGNIPGLESENTFCYKCKKRLISRFGFTLEKNVIKDSKCPDCGAKIDGVGLG